MDSKKISMTPWQVMVVLLIGIIYGFAQQTEPLSSKMKKQRIITNQIVAEKILNFSDKQFYDADPALLSARQSQLLDMDYMGIAINGPQVILCDKQNILPLIMATRVSGERDWEVNLLKNCYIVATNYGNGQVLIAKTFFDPKERRFIENESPVKGSKPPGLSIAGAQVTAIDVRNRIPYLWKPGNWSLSMIYYDWLSNSIDLQLIGVDSVPAAIPADQVQPEPDYADITALPSYIPTAKTPQSPDTGVTFSVGYYQDKKTKYLNVSGAFSVPARDFHLPGKNIVHKFQNGIQKQVAAIIPLTFIMICLDANAPFQCDWNVPVYTSPVKKGKLTKGCFAIEVLSSENIKTVKTGNFACYIALDGRIYGPKTVQIQETGKQ